MNNQLTAYSFDVEFRRALGNPYFLIAFTYFFFLLFAYYLLRPVREEMGILAGIDKLQWLYTGTFVVMILIIPVFGFLKNTLSRWVLVMGVYVFFMVNVLIFYALFMTDTVSPWTARAFFVWLSVFNMFAVSVFWSLMADVLSPSEAKILFGPISAGGSLGGICGSFVTSMYVEQIGIPGLLLVAALLLAVVAITAGLILRRQSMDDDTNRTFHVRRQSGKAAGSIISGVTEILHSGYLARITALGFLYTVVASLLYFVQANLVSEFIVDSALRTKFFAQINLAINIVSLLLQFFVTSLLIRRMGVGTTYGMMVAIILSGIVVLGLWPVVATLAIVQILFRSGQFGTMKPCYDMFFSAVTEEQKYKSKNFIDTSVVRSGDLIGGWFFTLLKFAGLTIGNITAIAGVGMVVLGYLGVDLGRRFDRRGSASQSD